MFRKIIVVLVLVLVFSSAAYCQSFSEKKNSIGIDFPTFGWLLRNDQGQIEANLGINYGLGISYKRYFSPMKIQDFNPFWAVGSILVILPYAGVGVEYVWPNGWYFGGGVYALSGLYMDRSYPSPRPLGVYVGPEIHGGYMF